jgi:predicted RNA-binding Zn ribbon-like protein
MSAIQTTERDLGDAYLLVGDHLALDLLNTQAILNGQVWEFWHEDADVLRWFEQVGVSPRTGTPALVTPGLRARAIALRETARALILQRKRDGTTGDPALLNSFLRAWQRFPQLAVDASGTPRLLERTSDNTDAQLLGEVAAAVARLLVEGDFELVKECEHPECVMWFYDRTKAHKRRWCSMALCGNRHKAAQFRKRSAAAET